MAIVIPDLSGLGQGIQVAGSALASALERRAERRLGEKRRSTLDEALQASNLDSQLGQQDFLRRAIAADVPLQDALGILDRAIKQQSAAKQAFDVPQEELQGLFKRLGVPEEVAGDYANLYGSLSTGGKTSFANMFIDKLQRGEFGAMQQASLQDVVVDEHNRGGEADVEAVEEGFVFPKVDLFRGLTPKEKVARQKELFNANAKDFGELSTKIKSLKDDAIRADTLQRYNESGRLPEGMEKLNINWSTGDIRFPALANAETQGFVKTVNDFTVKAKETFGARVTNFELGAFMRRLPTLANSTEGRRQIIEQMKAMGELDRLYYDSLKEVYDNYGLRGIDKQQAEKIAEELRAPKEEALKRKVADATRAQEAFEAKQVAPAGKIAVMSPDGNIGYVSSDSIQRAEQKGYRRL